MQPKSRYKLGGASTTSSSSEAGWAVSYADFLMVLLSFFIVFFSLDQKNSLYHVIASFNASGTGKFISSGTGGTGTGTEAGSGVAGGGSGAGTLVESGANMSEIARLYQGATFSTVVRDERVLVELPENLYRIGEFEVPEQALSEVLKPLEKFQTEITITVIGHADSVSFAPNKKVVRNNLVLSSVRAAYASTYIHRVLPQVQVWIQAADDSARNSRTLSLSIEARKGMKK